MKQATGKVVRLKASSNTKPLLPTHLLRIVAVEASCDPRTIAKFLRGQVISPLVRERVLRALKAHGLLHLVQASESESSGSVE